MIHYVCDACKRSLDADEERYVLRIEVYEALGASEAVDGDRDHLTEMHDYLESRDGSDMPSLDSGASQQFRYDLCSKCRKNFLVDPLGRRVAQTLGFSQN